MKRYILTCAASLMALVGWTQELTTEQMQLRKDVYSTLKSNGYTDANIDRDGDVIFKRDGIVYWVSVNENWQDPYMLCVCTGFPYDDDKNFTKENVEGCLSMVNQLKTVKLFCDDNTYTLRSDIICKDAAVFKQTIEAILGEQEKAQQYIAETISSGLGGVDLTGNKEAIFEKAFILYIGGDYGKAFKLFSYVADAGYPPAYSMLGMMYEDGEGVSRNEALMVENYDKAIENGQSWCGYKLGKYYYDNKKYPKALDYFTMTSACDNSYRSESYYMVGLMNEEGSGVTKNLSKAIQNYRKAVEYSDKLESEGRLALIRLGEEVENPSEFVDISKSMLADLTAEDMYTKGEEYENGMNNRKVSLPKAYGYFKASADRNNTKAMLKMGDIYVSKYYPFNDKSKSDKYYSKVFKALKQQESNSGDANYQLGKMYMNGLGVEQNKDIAMSYFKTAIGKGVTDANYELGLIFKEALEYVEAFNCFMTAAENEHPAAMLEVARAYDSGLGTSKNKDNAISWYLKCENTDSPSSIEATEVLRKLRTNDDEKE